MAVVSTTFGNLNPFKSVPSPVTDSTLYKFTLIFDKDGDYKVKTTATDAATNTKSDDEFEFTIDTVAPELEVTYTAYNKNQTTSLLDPSKGRAYANEAVDYVTATAVMTERNFSAENVVAVVKAVNSQNADVSVADYAAAIFELAGKRPFLCY